MKKLIVIFILFTATPAFADYIMTLKHSGGAVLKNYSITTNQVSHLQKQSTATGKSVLTYFKEAIRDLIVNAKAYNKYIWERDNEAYIEERSRQP